MTNYPKDAIAPIKNAGVLAASDNTVGAFAGNSALIFKTFILDTAIYASGDVLSDSSTIRDSANTPPMREVNRSGVLQSFMLIDEDDQGMALDVIFFDSNVSLGANNAVVSITDANARHILGIVSVASGDWNDLGGCRIVTKTNLGMLVKPALGTQDVYVALVSKGTGTYTINGIKGRFAFMQD